MPITFRTHRTLFMFYFAACLLLLLVATIMAVMVYSYSAHHYGLHPVVSIPIACLAAFIAGACFINAVNEYS